MNRMPGLMPCSRCGQPTAGVELSPGSISAVCRPGEGCQASPDAPGRKKSSPAIELKPKKKRGEVAEPESMIV